MAPVFPPTSRISPSDLGGQLSEFMRRARAAMLNFVPRFSDKRGGTGKPLSSCFIGQLLRNGSMKKTLIFLAAGLALAASVASAEETRVGVGVGPVGAGVTVGESPRHER